MTDAEGKESPDAVDAGVLVDEPGRAHPARFAMSGGGDSRGDDPSGPSPRVAAAAIRDAIDALEAERPDIAARLRELLGRIESPPED